MNATTPTTAIPGLVMRPFRDADDYTRLAELISATHRHDGIPWLPTAENLQVEMEGSAGVNPARDVILAEVDGALVAAAGVERVMRDGMATFDVWGNVLPANRRRGLGASLLAWNLRRATERGAEEDLATPIAAQAHAEDDEIGHRHILTEAGFESVRHFFLMRREALDDIPDAPLHDGIEIRPVTPSQHRAIFDAENEAFRDHWGSRELGEDALRTQFARSELDTDLWVVAWDGDQVAGVVQNWIWQEENEQLGVRRGWLERISVRRPWRRRGLGRALTAAALIRLREAGLDEAMLGVDSENANGALGLYESLGFAIHRRAVAFRRSISG